jgi:hypothetical protein
VQFAAERVLTTDPFSFSMGGTAWRTQSWLVEILYAQFEARIASMAWANLLVFGVGAVVMGLIGLSLYRSTRSAVTTGFAMIVMVWLAAPFLQARPVLFSYVLLALLVLVLQNRREVAWLIVPIIWIWAGVHGSWVIGGGLILLEWLRTSDRRLLKAGTIALVAATLTAHGFGVWQILLDFARAQDALTLMAEWKVPEFVDIVQIPYLLLIAGIVVAGMRDKLTGRDLIVILPFLFFGMTSRRAVFPAAIVVAPWAALAIPPLRIPRSSMSSRVAGIVGLALALSVAMPLTLRPLGMLDPESFPSTPLREATSGRHLFHDDGVGGFLIYSDGPDQLVYIDDRAELYGYNMLFELGEARQGRYVALFDRYGFNAALLHKEWPLVDSLGRDGWRRVAEDDEFVVFYAP